MHGISVSNKKRCKPKAYSLLEIKIYKTGMMTSRNGGFTVFSKGQQNGTHYNAEDVTEADDGAIYISSLRIIQKDLHLISVVQLISVGGCRSGGWRR